MDRDVMRQRVFSDPAAKLQLEAIIHPLVSHEAARQARQALHAGCALLVFDIPLLVESKRWRQQLGKVLVVDCEETTQVSRVMARESIKTSDNRGWTHDAVEKVIASQATRSQRRAAADWVIYNDGLSLNALAEEVQKIIDCVTL